MGHQGGRAHADRSRFSDFFTSIPLQKRANRYRNYLEAVDAYLKELKKAAVREPLSRLELVEDSLRQKLEASAVPSGRVNSYPSPLLGRIYREDDADEDELDALIFYLGKVLPTLVENVTPSPSVRNEIRLAGARLTNLLTNVKRDARKVPARRHTGSVLPQLKRDAPPSGISADASALLNSIRVVKYESERLIAGRWAIDDLLNEKLGEVAHILGEFETGEARLKSAYLMVGRSLLFFLFFSATSLLLMAMRDLFAALLDIALNVAATRRHLENLNIE